MLCQQRAKALRGQGDRALLRAGEADDAERAERRVEAVFAERDLLAVEILVPLRGGQLQDRVVWHRRLDQRAARQAGAPAAADDLRDKAEHAFIRAEALPEQQRVDAQDADEGDFFKVQPLGDHLRAQQDVVFLPAKLGQHRLVGVFLPRRVLVHAQNARLRQQLVQFLFHALGAEPAVADLAAARGAKLRQRAHRMPAVVAHQRLLRFVVDHRHAAVGAFEHLPAGRAHAHRVVAAPVQQQDALFPVLQVGFELLHHAGADLPRVAGGKFGAHVDEIDTRQRAAAVAPGQRDELVFAGFGRVVGLGARRGRGKHQQRVFHRRALFGNVVRVIARSGLALVGVFLFLIHNDEPQVLQRCKHSAARANDDVGVPLLDHAPLQQALGIIEGGMLHGQPAAER